MDDFITRHEGDPEYLWHNKHAVIWKNLIPSYLTPGKTRWLEIGSYEGRSARWTYENLLSAGDELVCVDVWDSHPDIERNFDKNIGKHVTKCKIPSQEFLTKNNSMFDVIYIDGSHDGADIYIDAALAWLRLKPGGLLIFDDYEWKPPWECVGWIDPKVAIDSFLAAFKTRISVLQVGMQVIVQKRKDALVEWLPN